MANAKIGVNFDPVNTRKVDAALARLQAQAKGVDFGGGARSISKLSRPLGKITGQASEFQKSLEASNARVLAFGASVAVINKLSEAFGALVRNTVKVEASFAKINVILGGSQKEIEAFGNGIFKVAQQTGTSFDQVAEGALELARQGLSVSESLSRVETSLKLVRVAGIDSEKAVAGLTAAIKGFSNAGLTVADIADKLSAADTAFAVSTEDLINGLERAAASARVAGVSFDELLAVVTTVQERTQRGGAVIGNAFKTIFARLARVDNLRTLEDLGIQVLDAENNVRSAIPLIQEFAKVLDDLGLRSEKATKLIDQVAGVRQRDILISLVEDLNSSQSQFSKVLNETAAATGALDRKNKQLNDTLEALINNVTVAGQKLASTLGEIGFTDAAKNLLQSFGNAIDGLNDLLDGDGIGSKFAQGIIKGFGSVLSGPGLALIGAVFTKLFIDLAKFGASSLQSLLGINTAAQQQAALQQSVYQTLLQNEAIQSEILKLEGNKVAQEQLLLKIYTQQIDALNKVQAAAARVTPGLFGAGLRGGEGGVTRRSAGGYVAAEARDVSRGVGGASANSKVVSIPNFAFGGGQRGTMIANTSEYYVPNYAGGGDAIFNQNMVRSMGLPKGAKKLTASGGFIPNFAAPRNFQQYMQSRGLTPRSLPGAYKSTSYDAAYRSGSPYREAYDALTPTQQRNIAKGVQQKGVLSKTAKGKPKFGLLYSDVVGGTAPQVVPTRKGNVIQTIPIDTQPPNALYSDIRKNMVNTAVNFAATLGFSPDIVKDSNFKQIVDRNLNPGAVDAAFGSVFESAFQGALGTPQKSNAIFDLPNKGVIQRLVGQASSKGVIGRVSSVLTRLTAADFKNALNSDNVNSLDNKIANYRGASGFIPNFANPLADAIGRERAAGLPISQIRINQSGKLRNAQNPMGLAVTNTRDEPTGAIPNFAASSNINVKQAFDEMNKAGKSAKELGAGMDGALTKVFALQIALSSVTSAFTEQDSAMQKFSSVLTDTINTLLVLQVAGVSPTGGGLFKGFGKGGFGALFKNLKSVAGIMGKLKMVAGPVAIGFTALNAILKVTTGKGVFGLFNDALVSLGLRASETSKTFFEANKRLFESSKGAPLSDRIDTLISEREKAARAKELAASGKIKSKDLSTNETLATLFDLGLDNRQIATLGGGRNQISDKVLKQITEAIGPFVIKSIEELEQQFPGLDPSVYGDVVQAQKDLLGKLSNDLTNVRNPNEIANVLYELQTSILFLYTSTRDDFNRMQAAAKEAAKNIPMIDSKEADKQLSLALQSRSAKMQAEFLGLRTDASGNVSLNNLRGGGRVPGTGGGMQIDDVRADGEFSMAGIEKARVTATRAESRLLDYEQEKLEAQQKFSEGKQVILENLIKELDLAETIGDVNKADIDAIKGKIASGASVLEIIEEIEKSSFNNVDGIKQQIAESEKLLDLAGKQLETDKQIAEYNKQTAEFKAQQTEGIQGYLNAANKELSELQTDFPKTVAQNFEDAMANTLNNIGKEGYDSLGKVFGQLALDFGQSLLQEMNRITAKNIAANIVGGNSGQGGIFGQGGFFSKIGNALGGNRGTSPSPSGGAVGGLITGGNGVTDDVPMNLMGGEYIMRKSAVQKYGTGFFDKLNAGGQTYTDREGFTRAVEPTYAGGMFVPGTRGQGEIAGTNNLLAFAMGQGGTTAGLTDRISGGKINLEDQSRRLTSRGRFLIGSPSRDRFKSAQQQAFGLYGAQLAEDRRVAELIEQQEKARRNQFIGSVASAFLSAGLSSAFPAPGAETVAGTQLTTPMAQAGEYVIPASTAASVGRGFLDDLNNGNTGPSFQFANGGPVGSVGEGNLNKSENKAEFGDFNVNINIDNKGNASMEQGGGDTENKGQNLARKIKEVVVGVIAEEKRLSGSLFGR
jgi:TP901 family phage tail tape measure protein